MRNAFKLSRKMMLFVVILALLGGVLASPTNNIGGRVIGGKEATPHSRPYEAFIGFTAGQGGWLCGGALISHYYILTAGHCVEDADSALSWLGSHNVDQEESGRVKYESEKLILHEKYSQDDSNDIGLIKLQLSVTYTTVISPIALPTDSSALFVGDKATITGWGNTAVDSGSSSVLMEADVTILSYEECLKTSYVTAWQICTSFEDNKSACYGDSGSPLVDSNKIIGVCSSGTEKCTGGPSIYTNVAYFSDWVKKNSDVK